jgi:predicted nucleic-acid-binding protein
MRGLDTNILVGWVIEDTEVEFPEGETFFISNVVLAEFAWISRRVLSGEKTDLVLALEAITGHQGFVFSSQAVVLSALNDFRVGKAGYADFLLLHDSLASGAESVITNDRDAARHPFFNLPKKR